MDAITAILTRRSIRNYTPRQVPEDLVKELSMNRANAVKEGLVSKFNLDPNKFSVVGMGWDVPADSSDPRNHANRTLYRRYGKG